MKDTDGRLVLSSRNEASAMKMKQLRNKQPRILTRISAATALAMCASVSNATLIDGIVDIWNVDVNARFDEDSVIWDSLEPPGVFVNDELIQWGTPSSSPSSLSIDNSSANANVSTDGPAVANISVTHANNPIDSDSGELDSIQIASTLILTPDDPFGTGLEPATLTFTVLFDETPNAGGVGGACLGGGTSGDDGINDNGCADVFVIDQDALNFPFFYDLDGSGPLQNQQYFISFFELTNALNPLAPGACTTAGATSPCIGFLTREAATTTFTFAARITTERVNVPVPATLALVALGLAGMSLRAGNRKLRA
jgi:hypothetical protein